MGMGRPPIGEKAMTSAERVARWRERQAQRHSPRPSIRRWRTLSAKYRRRRIGIDGSAGSRGMTTTYEGTADKSGDWALPSDNWARLLGVGYPTFR